ncbi:MAG: hypothetical protein AAF206_05570 [Bacteroidota bacterium]
MQPKLIPILLLFAICSCQSDRSVSLELTAYQEQVDISSFSHNYYDYLYLPTANKTAAQADENRLLYWEAQHIKTSANRVNRSTGQLFLQLDSGRELSVQSDKFPLNAHYYFIGMIPQIRVAMFVVRFLGGGHYFFMDLTDGNITILPGFPCLSPDQKHALIIDHSLGNYLLLTYRLEDLHMERIAARTLEDFEPVKMKWLDAQSFLLQGHRTDQARVVQNDFMYLKGRILH